MLILSRYIAKHELKPLKQFLTVEDLIEGANKVLRGLGQSVSVSKVQKNFRFFKVRIGRQAKGRMVVFMLSEEKKIVPLLIRLKKDKKMGMNMAANNPHVVDQIDKNLTKVIEDIEKGDFEEFVL